MARRNGVNAGLFRDPRKITAPITPHREAQHTLISTKPRRKIKSMGRTSFKGGGPMSY